MSFKIGDKVAYCGNEKYLKFLFSQEREGQETKVGEIVDIFKSEYFGGPIVKVKFENGYLAGREEDFRIYEGPKNKEEALISMVECIQKAAEEEEFLEVLIAAIEKNSPDLISKFMASEKEKEEEEENCCCEDECECDEGCNCECENCKCSPEPYSGKIYCVKSDYGYITEGKIYEVKEGKIEADDGWTIVISPEKGSTGVLSTFEELTEMLRGEWIEVKETEEIISPSNYEADIICIYSGPIENFTRGKVYRVENGYLYDDKKNKISWYGVPFTDINGINSYCASIFKEIKH